MRKQKLNFKVEINEKLDELFGNCIIKTLYRNQVVRVDHTHIPLSELSNERVQAEIQKIVEKTLGIENAEIKATRKRLKKI